MKHLLTFVLLICFSSSLFSQDKLPFRTLIQDDTTFHADQPIVFAIQTKHEEDGIISKSLATQALPSIDYSKETVLVILGGKRKNTGIKLSIDSLVQNGTSVKVFLHESKDTGKQFKGYVPAHIVLIKKTKMSLDFDQAWFAKHSKK